MTRETHTRRGFLATCATGMAAAVAGCSVTTEDESGALQDGDSESTGEESPDVDPTATPGDESQSTGAGPRPYVEAYRAVSASVARVRVYTAAGTGGGTAWLYDEDHLVTNEHVVSGATDVYVRFPEGGWTRSEVVGTDVYSDLAVLSVDATPENATPLTMREADPPVGTEVIAIGNPFQRTGSVSAGIVSGVDRTLRLPSGFSIPDAIQTDAAVNPGNSGGPLVALDGEVLGVINAGSGDNVGFAISGALTRRVVPELVAEGDYDHSYMGIRLRSVGPLVAEANDVERGLGVYVAEVVDGGPSDGVLRGSTGETTVNGVSGVGTGGDVILAMDDTPIEQQEALSTFLALETSPGSAVDVTVLRDGTEQTVELTLGSRPEPQ
ncbi:MAG: trypsin-like peptidase domain-containing protein [Haloarculaceae archaeon]